MNERFLLGEFVQTASLEMMVVVLALILVEVVIIPKVTATLM